MFSWFCCLNNGLQSNDNQNHFEDHDDELQRLTSEEIPMQTTATFNEKNQNPKKTVIKVQPNKLQNSSSDDDDQIFFCCTDKIREDQVDCCPNYWFREIDCSNQTTKNAFTCRQRFQAVIWRLCFVVTCLPLCYPCYLCRTIRRRRKKNLFMNNPTKKNLDDLDNVNRTFHTQVTRVDSDPKKSPNKPEVKINVNVIRLHSPASRILDQYFQSTERSNNVCTQPNDTDEVFLPNTPKIQVISPPSNGSHQTNEPPKRNSHIKNRIASNLYTLPENDEAVITTSIEVTPEDVIDGKVIEEEDGANGEEIRLRRHSKTIHKNSSRRSSIVMGLSRLRRQSFRKKSLDEDEHTLRRRNGNLLKSQPRRVSRKLSIVSGGSIYYSFDEEEDSGGRFSFKERHSTSHEMVTLGTRTVAIRDLDSRDLMLNFFDEASVHDWKGHDLRQANRIPNIDVLLLAIRKDNEDELKEVMKLETGLLGYIDKYWRGFFPILVVELFKEEEEFHIQNKEGSEEYVKLLAQLNQIFGEVHKVSMKESESLEEWLLKNMTNQIARLFLHARIYQCSRFFGADVIKTMPTNQRCPGGCGLHKGIVGKSKILTHQHKNWKKATKRKRSTVNNAQKSFSDSSILL